MVTPYDWQENMGHRARFVESRLESGAPVVGMSIAEGVLIATFRHQANKVFDIYDRIAYSAVGLQSDVEAIRVAAIEFCHQEGFRRSESDVTIQRLATHLSQPVKRAFGDLQTAPMVVRSLFCEVGDKPEQDRFYAMDYDGDYSVFRGGHVLAGSAESAGAIIKAYDGFDFATANQVDALAQLRESLLKGIDPDGSKALASEIPELVFESALLRRDSSRTRRFVRLAGSMDE
jgi:proteasome alpha subunit